MAFLSMADYITPSTKPRMMMIIIIIIKKRIEKPVFLLLHLLLMFLVERFNWRGKCVSEAPSNRFLLLRLLLQSLNFNFPCLIAVIQHVLRAIKNIDHAEMSKDLTGAPRCPSSWNVTGNGHIFNISPFPLILHLSSHFIQY